MNLNSPNHDFRQTSTLLLLGVVLLFMQTVAFARPGLKGIVIDEVGLGIANVEVTVNGQYTITTDRYGAFQFEDVSPYIDLANVEAIKLGFKMTSWGIVNRQAGMEIHMKRSGSFAGRVQTDDGTPVARASVKIEGAQPFGPVSTDEKGMFSMNLPSSVKVNAFTKFSIDNKPISDNKVKVAADNTSVEITYNPLKTTSNRIVERTVEKITVTNEDQTIVMVNSKGKPLKLFSMTINDKPYTTNPSGEIILPAKDVASFKIVALGYKVQPSSQTHSSGNIQFVVTASEAGSDDEVVGSSDPVDTNEGDSKLRDAYAEEFNEIFEKLRDERVTLVTKSDSIRTKIKSVVDRLSNETTLSERDRANLTQYLLLLESELIDSNDALQQAQERTEETFKEMRNALLKKDSAIKAISLEKEKIELESQRDIIVFTAATLLLLVIAAFLSFFARRMREQKKKVEKVNTELNATKNKLETTIDEVNELNTSVTSQNQKITSSIRYAQTIQEAVLPTATMMTQYFGKEHFILYQPKDIVSGDFYWAGASPDGEKRLIIAVDCTGHGVPGGFMSMIGHSLLSDIIYYKGTYDPAAILTMLDAGIREALKQEQKINEDGMDVCCCMLEKQHDGTTKATFSGAMRPLYVASYETEKIEVIKGDHKSAGGLQLKAGRPFTNKERILQPNDAIYLTSDGFGDQHNIHKKKVGTRGLIRMIEERLLLDMDRQGAALKEQLNDHMEEVEQRDDIMIIGIKV